MKVYKVRGCDPLSEYDLRDVKKLDAEFFIYNYQNHGYEGSGFALWKKGRKYGYSYLGHCSCNGPVEDLNSIMYTITEIRKLAKTSSYEWQYAEPVLARLKEVTKGAK